VGALTLRPGVLLPYRIVKQVMKWKSTTSIRNAVARGELVRVKVGTRDRDWAITSDSVIALQAEKQIERETLKFFDVTPGQWASLKQARKRRG
jgi:hypothetical protein